MKRAVRILVFLLCVGFTVAAIVNVFGDNTEVEQMAKNAACEAAQAKPSASTKPAAAKPAAAAAAPDDCRMTMTRMSRTPFGQSFEFTGSSATRHVGCRRSLIFVGDYSCAVE